MKKYAFLLTVTLLVFAFQDVQAETITIWHGTTSADWNTSGNWSAGVPGGSTDTVVFNSDSTAHLSTTNNISGLTLATIRVVDPADNVSIGGNAFSLSSGIDLSSATKDLSIGAGITLSAAGTNVWNVASGRTVSSTGILNATNDSTVYEKRGLGTVAFGNAGATNIVSRGNFVVREGTVDFNGGSSSIYTVQATASGVYSAIQIGTASSTDTATLKIESGALNAASTLYIAGANGPADVDGRLIMTGGTLSLGGGRNTQTGTVAGAKAVIEMSGNAYLVSSYSSTAGGAISTLSSAAGSVTDITMHNTAQFYQQGGFYIGGNGAVNLTMDGDSVFRGRRNMIFANGSSASATLGLSGNALVESSLSTLLFGNTGTVNATLGGTATIRTPAGQAIYAGYTNGGTGRIYMNGGSIQAGGLSLGRTRSGSGFVEGRGAIYQTAGSVVSQNAVGSPGAWHIGGDSSYTDTSDVARQDYGVYGYYGLSGTGSVDLHADDLYVGDGCTGVLDQSGGAFTTAGNVVVGNVSQLYHSTSDTLGASAGYGAMNVTAGTFTLTDPTKELIVSAVRAKTYLSGGSPVTVYYGGRAVLSIGGTGQLTTAAPIIVSKDVDGGAPDAADYKAIINLGIAGNPGGILTTPGIQVNYAGGTGTVNFHGGKLVATADNTDFVHAGVRIWSEGATIDTNGHDVTMSNGVVVPAGSGVATIAITDGGAGYLGTPFVLFNGGGGSGATGYPVMVDDGTGTGGLKIDHIVVTNPGVGYTSAPTISFTGKATTEPTVGTVTLNSGNEGGGLDKIGDGTLTFSSPENYNSICRGNFNLKQGTVVFNGGATSKYVIADATLAGVKGRINVGDSSSLESTTLQIDSGLVATNSNAELCLGAGEGASDIEARLIMTGGTLEARKTTTGAATDVSAVIQMSGTANFVSSYSSTSGQAVSTLSSASGSSLDMTMHNSALFYQQGGFYVGNNGDVNLTMDGDTVFRGKRAMYFASGSSSDVTLDLSGNALVESLKADANGNVILGLMGQFKATLAESATLRSQAGQMIYMGLNEGGRGRIYMNGGTLQAGGLSLGQYRSGSKDGQGAIYQTAGVAVSQNAVGSPGVWRLGGDDTFTSTSDVARQGSGVYGCYALSGTGTVDLHADNLYVGDGGTGVIDQSGGSFTTAGNVYLGYVSQLYHSSSDTLGGSAGSGDLNVTAGTFTTTDPSKEFVVSATRPKTYISEGNPITVNYTGKGVLSVGGTGQVTIASPITLTKDVDGVAQAVGYDYAGIVNVGIAGNPGGTLTVPGIQLGSVGSNDGMVNFHGGTLVASSDNPDFVHVLSRVWPEGAKIDTNGHDVTMDRAVKAPWGVGVESIAVTDGGAGYIGTPVVSFSGGGGSGATGYAVMEDDGAGGLMVDHIVVTNPGVGYSSAPTVSLLGEGSATSAQIGAVALNVHNASGPFEKLGPGTLTLAAGENLNYTGNTTISEGTLKLIAETMISDSPVIDVLQGAFLDVSGQSCLSLGATVAQTLKGQGVVVGDVVAAAGGSIEPGESPGVLTIDGDLDMSADTAGDGANMTWELAALKDDVDGAPGADFDQLLVLGELTLGGASQLTLDFSLLPTSDRPDAPTLNSFWQISHSWKIIDAGTNPGQTNFTVLAGAEGQFTTSVGTGPGDAGDVYLIYVPEPSGFVLLALGLLGVAAYARRRR